MNLEKTINKNMFDMSNAMREQNPISTNDLTKIEVTENSSFTSILSHPKQKLTAQFKRAITMMKQRSEPSHDSSPTLRTSTSMTEKPLNSFDSALLTSLIEEPTLSTKPSIERSQSIHETDSTLTSSPAATIVNLDPYPRMPSNSTLVKKSLHQIHSSILQSITPSPVLTSSSSSTNPVPTSSSSSTTGTGDMIYLETLL